VILDQLVLENIGVFAGRNEIELTPPSAEQPVVLVGGLNGAGKTTILEAIHLALYGPLAEGSSRRTGSYETYLRSLIHQPVRAEAVASVELAFHAYSEGVSRSYRIRRAWRDGSPTIREQLQVTVNGMPDQALAESWAEYIEGFLPRGIAGLFFFDGEQIESLANLDRSRQVLASALAALLGLDLVDRLTADLAVLRRRHRSSQLPDELRRRADETKLAGESARLHEREAFDALAEARTLQARAAKHCSEAADRYRANGGDLYDQRQGYERRAADLRKELDSLDDELREVASEAAPFLQVTSALRKLAVQARTESDAVRERVVLDVLDGRDVGLLDELRRVGANASVIETIDAFLEADRNQRRQATATDPISGLSDPASVDFLVGQIVPDTQRKLRALIARRAETQAGLEGAERLLTSIPDPEALAPFSASYEDARKELTRAEGECARAEERHRTLAEQRVRAVVAYERAVDGATHASLAVDDDRRLVEHADRVRLTLNSLKANVTRRHVERIAALVLESLRTLMRKENLITEISIDPATYAVELRGATSQLLSSEQLSVGERQMLAVALLWGLARSAGQPLPIVIDTPLGRLDSAHRRHLLERYFPHASHQVILLSTDTEINGDAWRTLAPHVGRAYHLEFDPSVAATTVRSGYFWES
jgi:DNA sulfur modification protein DndD